MIQFRRSEVRERGTKDEVQLVAITYIIQGNLVNHTHPLTLSRTCEARALCEVHRLHAHGKLQMCDVPCENEE
jgi:hypothetical protein